MKQKKLKYIAKINRDVLNNSTADDYVFNYIDISSIGTGDIKQDLIELSFAESPSRARRIVHVGDTIISTVRTYLKSVCHFEVIDTNTIASTGFAVLTPNKGVHPKYLYYSVLSNDFIEDVCARSTGVSYPAISEWGLGQIPIFIWDYSEQKKIASFLDQKCSQIDAQIEKKQKLVELKKEERTALINQAVTKGLDPKVPMKDSGIEWLGEIPEHWEVKKLKYVSMVQPSNVDKKSNEGELSVLLCNYVDVYMNEIIDNSITFMKATANNNEIEKFKLIIDDVLITKDSETPDDIAVPALVKIEKDNLLCGYHLAQIRSNKSDLNGEYLFRLFQSKAFNKNFSVAANGITRFGLGVDSIKNVVITLPPVPEQIAIATHIHRETGRIDAIIEKTQKQIELLKEYKTTLISEAVTGKIIPA